MAEGRYTDALRHLVAARDFIVRKRLDSGIARFAKERLAEKEDECRAALMNSAATDLSAQLEEALAAQMSGRAGTSVAKEPRPFPWIGIAAIAILGIIVVLTAVVFR